MAGNGSRPPNAPLPLGHCLPALRNLNALCDMAWRLHHSRRWRFKYRNEHMAECYLLCKILSLHIYNELVDCNELIYRIVFPGIGTVSHSLGKCTRSLDTGLLSVPSSLRHCRPLLNFGFFVFVLPGEIVRNWAGFIDK